MIVDKILLSEVNAYNINRLIVPLANHLVDSQVCKEAILVCDSYVPVEIIDTNKFSRGVSLQNVKKEYRLLKKNKDTSRVVFITNGYRISDIYWTEKFKKQGAFCYQVQHGMYAEFLRRDLLGYFSSIGKKLRYFQMLLSYLIRFKIGISIYLINKDFIKSFKINRLLNKRFRNSLTPVLSDHLFLWGEYWKQWFIDNHFYKSEQDASIVGNPDYHVYIKDKNLEKKEGHICYIAQSYVEDGRMKREDYKNIIDQLAENFAEKLIIKLHPRSDKSLYEKVVSMGGELTNGFPIPSVYIGHYSSLLALAINEDAKVFLLEINNEEIPEYYKNSATKVFQNINELIDEVLHGEEVYEKSNISHYFENIEEHPFDLISRKILKDHS